MALYQLTLFYPNLKSHAATVKQIRSDVEAMAGPNWRVLSAGEPVCGIAFATELPPAQIGDRLQRYSGIEQFHFLLVEIGETHAGHLTTGVWQWLASQRTKRPAGTAR